MDLNEIEVQLKAAEQRILGDFFSEFSEEQCDKVIHRIDYDVDEDIEDVLEHCRFMFVNLSTYVAELYKIRRAKSALENLKANKKILEATLNELKL